MCIILGIGLNIIGCAICDWLALPLRGDVVGTMFAAILLGPLAGMIVSILSGLYFLMLFDIPFVYTCIGIIVGMIIGLLFPRKNSTDSFTIVSIANIAAIVSALMSIPLNLTLRDGKPDNFFGNALYDMLGIYVNNDYSVTFMSELFVDVPDRVISIGVALFLIKQIHEFFFFSRISVRIADNRVVSVLHENILYASGYLCVVRYGNIVNNYPDCFRLLEFQTPRYCIWSITSFLDCL